MHCSKCGAKVEKPKIIVEGGFDYAFCIHCSDVLKYIPPGKIDTFVTPDNSRVYQKIRETRAKKNKNILDWQKNPN